MARLFVILILIFISACPQKKNNIPPSNHQPPPPPTKPSITPIGDILQGGRYINKMVVVQGEFKGWSGISGPPPVTRSDWVIADKTGAIYVTGPYPPGCSPPSQGIGKIVTISARVKISPNKIIYLEE